MSNDSNTNRSWKWEISDVFMKHQFVLNISIIKRRICCAISFHWNKWSISASLCYITHRKVKAQGHFSLNFLWLYIVHRRGTKCFLYKSVIIELVCHPGWADPSLNTTAHFRDLRVQRGSVRVNMRTVRNVRLTHSCCAICGLYGKI